MFCLNRRHFPLGLQENSFPLLLNADLRLQFRKANPINTSNFYILKFFVDKTVLQHNFFRSNLLNPLVNTS